MPDKFAAIVAEHPDLASEPVRLVGFMLREYLTNMLADGDVDTGFGFGDACLDFRMDGQDMRVIVKLPLVAVQPEQRTCMACEGTPKEENNPCAVCGKVNLFLGHCDDPVQPDDATVERALNAFCDVFSDGNAQSLDDMPPMHRDKYRAAFTAALAAMKGPKP